MNTHNIGELLIEEGYVTPEQLKHAQAVQHETPKRLCNLLVELGYLKEDELLNFLCTTHKLASIDLQRYKIEHDVVELIPEQMAVSLEIMPIGAIRNILTVAAASPLDASEQEKLSETTGMKVKPVLCSRGAVLQAIEKYYRKLDEIEMLFEFDTDPGMEDISAKFCDITKLIGKIDELPSLPEILNVISSIADDPNSTASDLAEIISADAALSGRVLKLANSAAFGFSRTISSLKHAIALLGFRKIRTLALSACVLERMSDCAGFNMAAYRKHSLACAILSRLISRHMKSSADEIAFSAGLLHDMGKAGIAMTMPEKREQLSSLQTTGGMTDAEAEEEVLGIGHAEVGFLLGEHWLLPEEITQAIRYHHSPDLAQEPDGYSRIIHLSDFFCKMDLPTLSAMSSLEEDTVRILKELRISEPAFLKILHSYAEMISDETAR